MLCSRHCVNCYIIIFSGNVNPCILTHEIYWGSDSTKIWSVFTIRMIFLIQLYCEIYSSFIKFVDDIIYIFIPYILMY